MSVEKAGIGNSSFIGAYAIATDLFTILSSRATISEEKLIRDTLETKVVRSTVDGSSLVGIYTVANSNGILLPEIADRSEISNLKAQLEEVNISVIRTDLNALRNNILANDKVAFINPEYSRKEAKEIEDTLGVEAVRMDICGYSTVGASNVLTNKGMVVSGELKEDEEKVIKQFSSSVSQSTANMGASSIGLCTIANSNGMVVGYETTGFELVRLSEGLDL